MNMDKEAVWSIFEATGNIDMYLLYHELTGGDDKLKDREDLSDADQDRRPGYSGL